MTGGTGNAAGSAAGGAFFARNGATKFYNSTISGNKAAGGGGGIYIFGTNTAPSASFIVRNTIIASNGANACFVNVGGGTPTVALAGSGNLIRDNAAGSNACPAVVSTANPLLGPLQINTPGNTPTMAIPSGTPGPSPAFNTGDNAACLATDQRGVTRPQGAGCDIGAYEVEFAEVSITKTSDSDEVIAGEDLFYTITVFNDGPGTARNVVVTDVLPVGLRYLADSAVTNPAGGCTVVSNPHPLDVDPAAPHPPFEMELVDTVTCNLVDIPNNGVVTFKIKVHVASNFLVFNPDGIVTLNPDGTKTLVNTASIVSQVDTDLTNNSSTAYTFVTDESDLRILKFVEPFGSVAAGQVFIYTIYVDNLGPSTARDVIIRDTLLNHPDVSIQSCAFSVSQAGSAIEQFSCTTGPIVSTQFGSDIGSFSASFIAPLGPNPLAPASPFGRLRASFRLVANNATTITNLTTVSSPTPDPVMSNNIAVVDFTVVAAADLSITKAKANWALVATTQVQGTAGINETQRITSYGPPTEGSFTITFEGQTTAPIPYNATAATIQLALVALSNIAPGDVIVTGGPINTSFVNIQFTGALGLSDRNQVTTTVTPPLQTVNAGDLLTYTLTVANNGPSVAENVVVKDDLPSWVSVVSVTSAGNSCTNGVPGDAAQPLTCNLSTMVYQQGSPISAAATVFDNTCDPPVALGTFCRPEVITVVVRVNPNTPDGTLLFNQARVSSDVLDRINSNNRQSVLTPVIGSADLAISKTGLGPNPWVSGEERTYRIDVDNLGPSLAKDVVVSDALPDGIEFVAAYVGGDAGQGGILTACTLTSENDIECKLGDLAASDGIKSLFVHVRVKANVPDGTVIDNTAVVSSDTLDAVPGNNSDLESKTMTIEADLAVVITTESNFFPLPLFVVLGPGDVAEELLQEFTITATNYGPSDAQKVLTTVDLPPLEVGYYVFDDGGCTKIDLVLACPMGTLAAGESRTFRFMFHINDDVLFVTTTAHIGIDEDLDLVPDGLDLCDRTPAGTAVDNTGCPVPDADGDLVVDAADVCPSTPAGTTVGLTGCPAADADADGVRDDIDLCPVTPPGTLVNLDGCPDADQDGVTDIDDACTGTPPLTSVTLIGCPLDPILSNNWFTKTLVEADGELPETR